MRFAGGVGRGRLSTERGKTGPQGVLELVRSSAQAARDPETAPASLTCADFSLNRCTRRRRSRSRARSSTRCLSTRAARSGIVARRGEYFGYVTSGHADIVQHVVVQREQFRNRAAVFPRVQSAAMRLSTPACTCRTDEAVAVGVRTSVGRLITVSIGRRIASGGSGGRFLRGSLENHTPPSDITKTNVHDGQHHRLRSIYDRERPAPGALACGRAMNLLDVDQLKTFVAIADTGSFTRAATSSTRPSPPSRCR